MMKPSIPWPGGVRLRHPKQLQSGSQTATTDCGPCALTGATQAVSGDGIRVPRDLLAGYIGVMRQDMTHYPFWPATSLPNHEEAVEARAMLGVFLGAGLYRPGITVQTLSHARCVELLAEGCALVVGLDYGRLNDIMPWWSGSPSFRGGHFVSLDGMVDGWTRLGDPLHDGRRKGIPKGWQTVRALRYLRAAETFGRPRAGAGMAKVAVLRPARER